jgi:hypothetical protein
VKPAGTSDGCNASREGSSVESFCSVDGDTAGAAGAGDTVDTGDADGACDAHPAMPRVTMMNKVIRITMGETACFSMLKHARS